MPLKQRCYTPPAGNAAKIHKSPANHQYVVSREVIFNFFTLFCYKDSQIFISIIIQIIHKHSSSTHFSLSLSLFFHRKYELFATKIFNAMKFNDDYEMFNVLCRKHSEFEEGRNDFELEGCQDSESGQCCLSVACDYNMLNFLAEGQCGYGLRRTLKKSSSPSPMKTLINNIKLKSFLHGVS